jgi:hypothetical protein
LRTQDYFCGGVPDAALVVSAGGVSFFFPKIETSTKKMIKKRTRPMIK